MSLVKKQIDDRRKSAKVRRYRAPGAKMTTLTWKDVKPENLVDLIAAAADAGGAVRFGMTSDGGALALGVYGDGDDPYTVYASSAEGMDEHIFGLQTVFEAMAAEKR